MTELTIEQKIELMKTAAQAHQVFSPSLPEYIVNTYHAMVKAIEQERPQQSA